LTKHEVCNIAYINFRHGDKKMSLIDGHILLAFFLSWVLEVLWFCLLWYCPNWVRPIYDLLRELLPILKDHVLGGRYFIIKFWKSLINKFLAWFEILSLYTHGPIPHIANLIWNYVIACHGSISTIIVALWNKSISSGMDTSFNIFFFFWLCILSIPL